MYDLNDKTSKEDVVEEKIELLKDFKILDGRSRRKEREIRYILSLCPNRIRMDNMLHDVLVGRQSVDDMLAKAYEERMFK